MTNLTIKAEAQKKTGERSQLSVRSLRSGNSRENPPFLGNKKGSKNEQRHFLYLKLSSSEVLQEALR